MLNNKKVLNVIILTIISLLVGVGIGVGLKKGDDILGLIGGIIGVIGAFGLFKYQSNYAKYEESELNSTIIKELLFYTIKETEIMINFIIVMYISIYVPLGIVDEDSDDYEILKTKVKGFDDKNRAGFFWDVHSDRYVEETVPYILETLYLTDSELEYYDRSLISSSQREKYFKRKSNPGKVREQIIEEFIKLKSNKNIVYLDNWSECIIKIQGLDTESRRDILIWLNQFSKNINKINKERKELDKRIKAINNPKFNDNVELKKQCFIMNKKNEKLKKDIIYTICDFIDCRDKVINLLKNYFKYEDIKTSTELLNEKFDNLPYIYKEED